MRVFTQVVVGLGFAAVGAAIAVYVQSKLNPGPKPFQVTGDPPVTVSDGSLHAHSRANGWQGDNGGAGKTILPKPANGSLHTAGCNNMMGDGKAASAIFWADDHESWDISPAKGGTTTVEITHDSKGAARDARIIITAPTNGQLQIETKEGSFDDEKGAVHNRAHSRQGEVEQITITGSNHDTTWKPIAKQNPHFTLGFCYQ
jgi:hypothetical protein